jgi:hypothetical protein
LGKNGIGGETASTSSGNSTSRSIHHIDDFLSHPGLEKRIDAQTRKTCEEVVEQFFRRFQRTAYPLMGIISALIIWIFLDSKASLNRLTESVVQLNATIQVSQQSMLDLQKESDRNHDGIERLKEQFYRK